jgi:hypothetical protein
VLHAPILHVGNFGSLKGYEQVANKLNFSTTGVHHLAELTFCREAAYSTITELNYVSMTLPKFNSIHFSVLVLGESHSYADKQDSGDYSENCCSSRNMIVDYTYTRSCPLKRMKVGQALIMYCSEDYSEICEKQCRSKTAVPTKFNV